MRSATVVLFFVILFAGANSLRAEYIFLKDGAIHQGKITADAAEGITVRLENGTVKTFPRGSIMRVLYVDLYLGKCLVWLKSGEKIEAYLVDEDNESFTFRKDIKKPEEFTIRRSAVQYIARANPTELIGHAGQTEIRLTWSAPYRKPRKYRVYVKEQLNGEYRLAGTTILTAYTLRGLTNHRTYYFAVSAIGANGKESDLSNEIQVRTNQPPTEPGSVRRTIVTEKKKVADIRLSWKPSVDPDGKVDKYRLYQINPFDEKKIWESAGPATETVLPGMRLDRDNRFRLHAVDQDSTESDGVRMYLLPLRFSISAGAGGILPVGKFWNVADPGLAARVSASFGNIGVNYLSAGLEAGYMRMDCKRPRSYVMNMVTGAAALSYRIELPRNVSLSPKLSGGVAWLQTTGSKSGLGVLFGKNTYGGIDPLAGAGLEVRYQATEMVSAGLDAGYGMLIESIPLHFVTLTANCTLRFSI